MVPESVGNYINIVVTLQAANDGKWYIHVDGTNTAQAIPLVPLTLIVRLWRASETGLLRGTIRLHGSDYSVPVQSNAQLEKLVRVWLLSGDNTSGNR